MQVLQMSKITVVVLEWSLVSLCRKESLNGGNHFRQVAFNNVRYQHTVGVVMQ